MAKAAIATIDLVFALAIASVFIISFASAQEQRYHNVAVERIGNDILTTMDKGDILSTMNSTIITEKIAVLLPTNLDSEINIECYSHCNNIDMDSSKEFYLIRSFESQIFETDKPNDLNIVKRTFIIDEKPIEYCVAVMGLWYR